MRASLPPNEEQRLLSLKALHILDTDPEQSFDDLVQLAAYVCGTAYALIGFIDEHRQWYKAKLGVEHSEVERELSFCSHALLRPTELTYVSDARHDPRFADNPAVLAEQGLRLYAGVPLLLEQQYAVGTLCVFDTEVKPLSQNQLSALQRLANQVMHLLSARLLAHKEELQRQTLETITNNVPILISQLDRNYRYLFCNDKYRDWYQLDPHSLIGKTPADLFGEEKFNEIKHRMDAVLAGATQKFHLQMPDQRILQVSYVPQRDQHQAITGFFVVGADVTLEQQQAEMIKSDRNRFESIIDSTGVGTWAWDIHAGVSQVNERWAQMLGYQLDELEPVTYQTWLALVHPDDVTTAEQQVQAHFRREQPYYDSIYRMRHKAGHWVWIHARGQVKVWSEQGQPLLMYGINTDITDSHLAEQELAQTKGLLQAVIDSSTEAALIATSLTGEIWLFNTGAERMLGYSCAEVLGKTTARFHKKDEIRYRQQQIRQHYGVEVSDFDSFVFTARQQGSETLQWTYLCKNGEEKQVRLSISPIYNPDGSPQGYLGVAIDITQLEQLNQALLRSEQRYRSMLDNLPGVMYRCKNDEFWTMLFISDEVSQLTGFEAWQFIFNKELNFASLYHPEDLPRVNEAVQQALSQKQRFSIEYRLKHKDGSWRWVQELGQGIFNTQGELLFIDGFIWDVTSSHEAIQALSDSEQKLSSLYQLAPVAIVLHNLVDGSFIEANPEFFRLYAAGSDTAAKPDYPGLMQSHYQHWRQNLLQDRRFGPVETELLTTTNQKVPVTLSSVLMDTSSGQQHIWTLLQDMTEQRRVEQMKNQFVSTVSHELRTPLTSISGSLGLISGGALGEVPSGMIAMLDIARENSLRLSKLINDLLDIDKLVAGKMHFDVLLCDAPSLLKEALLCIDSYASKYQVHFSAARLEAGFILVDPLRFQQIMLNLLSNAAKFSPPGSAVVVQSRCQHDQYLIEVLDQGPGIDANFAQRIFQKFSQADSADSRRNEGSGLGLAIVKELTEHMNGQVSFRNRDEGGCCFYLRFPQATTQPQSRLLVVEPDSRVADHMMQLLKGQNYLLDWARTLTQAIKALRQHKYQAITLDLNLPDGHGSALFDELRELELSIPVIIINSEHHGEQVELSGGLATLDWLETPGATKVLLDKLQHQLFSQPSPKPRILHIEDDPHLSQILQLQLAEVALCQQAVSLKAANDLLLQQQFDLIILDIGLPDGSGLALLPELARAHPGVPVVIWSAQELSHEARQQVSLVLAKSRVDMDTVLAQIKALLAGRR
ncbi:PAS domain S-box protein [Rheinheimera sp.]|uniref:PAS domain S-box protein n=1 Tax=Rheinheimera sp. TaxID=1869214 RepID=UPI00307D7DB5